MPSSLVLPTFKQDARIIGLVGLAHGTSHFFHLMLPTLFPVFIRDFGLSYAQLGRCMTLFFVVSGTGQALAGFLVDRVGPRPVLFGALACFAASALVCANATGWTGLAAAAALAGLGNAPFHPIDFTILNQRVSPKRLGHGFSVHGIAGNLGWAATPVFLAGLMALTNSWRLAVAGMGVWALVMMLILWRHADAIDCPLHAPAGGVKPKAVATSPFAFLRLPSVWLCFSFFFFSSVSLSAIQGFAGPALRQMYQLPELDVASTFVVTGYMLCGAAGMVVGGLWLSRMGGMSRLEQPIAICLAVSAVMLWAAARGWLPSMLGMGLVVLAGFGAGLAGPSRDMLIKQAAPPGAMGRVYGTVYSGLDIGFALAAPVFGAMLDRHMSHSVLDGSALALLLGVACALFVGLRVKPVAKPGLL
jgi:MFS transporter, FSR family, fosmidomycin resistance protein